MHIHRYFVIWIFVIIPFLSFAQKDQEKDLTVGEYIQQFKDIAIQEMERSEIPASITLAQGIHESAYGNSPLAKKSNNHFGIKCTKDWEGKSVKKWDDEAQKSCFRVYKSAEYSYVDHTDFLLNRKHYAFLFEYSRKDYKKWAKGLRKAGYATDPNYPDKLINTIEKYELAQYDKATGVLAYDTTKDLDIKDDGPLINKHKPRSFLFKARKPTLYRQNEATYAVSRKGESALAAAKRFGIPYGRFLKFNDLEDGVLLIDYQPVFIQPKKIKYRGDETFYKVDKDVTMYEIAQYYGVKLNSLLALNLITNEQEPQNGELIMLKEKAVTKPKLRPKNHIDILPSKYLYDKYTNKKDLKDPAKKSIKNVVSRPKPQKLEVGTPTYAKAVYADTAHINTSLSKDKDYLDVKVTGGTTATAGNTNAESNPFFSNRNMKPTERPKTSNIPIKNTRVTTTANSPTSGTRRSPSDTESSPFSSGVSTKVPVTIVTPNSKGVSSPRINDVALYGEVNTNKNTPFYTFPNTPNVAVFNNTPLEKESAPIAKMHLVKKRQTLYAIHRMYNVSVDAIKKANKLSSNEIKIGAQLIIPVK
jgi:LysM repeat protein